MPAKSIVPCTTSFLSHTGHFFRREGWRRAFTLIELLAVIAIIGLLAAITLATVSSVRGKAAQVRCISNLRQLGIATSMFMMENKNKYPQVNYWPKDIVPHLSVSYENVNSQEIKVVGSLSSNPYTCPAAISFPDTLYRGQFGYAINADGLAGLTPEKVVDPKICPVALQGVAVGKSQLLSQSMLYADAINYPNHLYRSPERVPDRHQSKVNVVFADFHAAPVRYAPESNEWKLMFFGFK